MEDAENIRKQDATIWYCMLELNFWSASPRVDSYTSRGGGKGGSPPISLWRRYWTSDTFTPPVVRLPMNPASPSAREATLPLVNIYKRGAG